jgi:hypothetical protein
MPSATNYSSGLKVGKRLFLPAAGIRICCLWEGDGFLFRRGERCCYWSSSEFGNLAYHLGDGYGGRADYYSDRRDGLSVRCIAE